MNKEVSNKIAIFPGSFDPLTLGHESIILRALPLFDKIIIAIGSNATKSSMFTIEERKAFIRETFKDHKQIEIMDYEGLTVDFCKKVNAQFILRGLRTSADFEFERSIGQVNKLLESSIETVFMLTLPQHTPISSSVVRDVIRHHGPVEKLVPAAILHHFKA